MNDDTKRKRIGCLVALGLSLAIGLLVIRGFTAFPSHRLSEVKQGMTMQEVERLVGKPYKTVRFEKQPDEIFWDYTRPFAFGYGGVVFYTNGFVKEPHYEEF